MPGERLIGTQAPCRRRPLLTNLLTKRAATDQPQVCIHGRWTASSRARKAECSWLTGKKSAEPFPRLTCHGSGPIVSSETGYVVLAAQLASRVRASWVGDPGSAV